MQAPWWWSKTETCSSDIYVYFNVNFNVFFKLIRVHLLVSELYIHQNARCNDKESHILICIPIFSISTLLRTCVCLLNSFLLYVSVLILLAPFFWKFCISFNCWIHMWLIAFANLTLFTVQTGHLYVLFCTMTNKFTIISQIITLIHVFFCVCVSVHHA